MCGNVGNLFSCSVLHLNVVLMRVRRLNNPVQHHSVVQPHLPVDNSRREIIKAIETHKMIQPIRNNPYAVPQTPTTTNDKPAQVVVTDIDISYFAVLWIGVKIIAAMPVLYIIGLIMFKALNTAIAILFTTAH